MEKLQKIKSFDDLSEKCSTWIIKYNSTTFDKSLFFVWYTDTDEKSTDRLLTYNDGKIFAVKSLIDLNKTLKAEIVNLTKFDNLIVWLDNLKNYKIVESCSYNLISVINNLDKNILDNTDLEDFANFINLYEDFINQDLRNKKLQVNSDNELIKKAWNYYYDNIFWPRFNDKEKFYNLERPKLEIDTKKLLEKFKVLIATFEDNIKLK